MKRATEPSNVEVRAAAKRYVQAGRSVFPVGKNKRPAIAKWNPYQRQHAKDEELWEWYSNGRRLGIAVVCGAISGGDGYGLEVIDIEHHATHLFATLAEEIEEHLPGLFEKLPIIQTPSGGFHIAYLTPTIEAGRRLAARHKIGEDGQPVLNKYKKPETELLIETRAEGQYVVTFPSPAHCHPEGGYYHPVAGDWCDLPMLTAQQRDVLIAICTSFNEYAEPVYAPINSPEQASRSATRPGEDFNARATWEEVLEPHGWQAVKRRGEATLWRKPGARKHPYHATTNYSGSNLFYVFSTNTEFEPKRGYNKFAAYTILNYGSLSKESFAAAARELEKQGYGEQRDYSEGSYKLQMGGQNRPPKVEEFNTTDLGNARRMLSLFGSNLRFVYRWGTWLCWDGRRWLADEGDAIQRVGKQTIQSIYQDASRTEDEDRRKRLAGWALRCEHPRRLTAMFEMLKSEDGIPITPDDLDVDPFLFNCQNGTIDLRTGQLGPHRREDLITKISSVAYDPNAKAPLFDRWLYEMMNGDTTLVAFLQRAIGYSLSGDTREHCLFLCHGTGANGKTTLINLLCDLTGDYSAVTPIESLMVRRQDQIPTDIARLKGARFVSASETEQGRRLAEAKIKQMTGGDKITARFLFSREFEFHPQFKLWISANHKPVIRGDDVGIWRRIRLIPFNVSIPEEQQDKTLPERLREELPGILAWAVRGCLDWLATGLPQPEAVKNATSNYQRDMDAITNFLEAKCIKKLDARVYSEALYKAFKVWAEANGETDPSGRVMSNIMFSLKLQEKGFEKRKDRRGAFWVNIGFFDEG